MRQPSAAFCSIPSSQGKVRCQRNARQHACLRSLRKVKRLSVARSDQPYPCASTSSKLLFATAVKTKVSWLELAGIAAKSGRGCRILPGGFASGTGFVINALVTLY